MKKPLILSTILTATFLISSCSSTTEEEPTVDETNISDITEVETVEEELTITYEINTPETIEAIISLWRDSSDRQKQSGFLESRQIQFSTPEGGQQEAQIILIDSPATPELIYYYDTSIGFSQVTKLFKEEIPYSEMVKTVTEFINFIIERSESEEALLEQITFKKEIPTNVYIMEESTFFGEKTSYRIEHVNGVISKITITNATLTETVALQYGISALAQQYIDEAFDPRAPFEDPFAEFNDTNED